MGYAAQEGKTGWPLYTPRYDGSFVAGLYAQDPELAGGRQAIAAIPAWSGLTVNLAGRTYSPETPPGEVSHFRQTLYSGCGLIETNLTWTATNGKAVDLSYQAIAHRVDEHIGLVRLVITPHFGGEISVTDLIDGRGARRIIPRENAPSGEHTISVGFETQTTKTAGAVASTLRAPDGIRARWKKSSRPHNSLSASQTATFTAARGRSYEFVKYVGVDTTLSSPAPYDSAVDASRQAASEKWPGLFERHAAAWNQLWRSDIELPDQPDLQAATRSGTYSLLSSLRPGELSIAPTGLSSDNYAGMIFWDAEIWMYPSLLLTHPDIARSMLDYRYATMDAARNNARKLGYEGLFFPWTSAGTGDLWSDCHSWDPPHCVTQIHLQGDIAWATWQYYLATGGESWLRKRGWPLLEGLSKFWASRVTHNDDGSYSLDHVAGPDEYSNDVTDGAYTNAGASLTLRNTSKAAKILGKKTPPKWNTIAKGLRIPFDGKRQAYLQYDGYRGSEIKQADTVLLRYPLEWPMSDKVAARTLAYYTERTDPDGPAMTDAAHAVVAADAGQPGCDTYTYLRRAVSPFVRGPFAQLAEARGNKAGAGDPLAGSPAFTFHTAAGGLFKFSPTA